MFTTARKENGTNTIEHTFRLLPDYFKTPVATLNLKLLRFWCSNI
jgi:hypothetical protein